MRVLLIDQYGELGGAQRALLEAAEGFAARGWSLHAAIPEGPLAHRLPPAGLTRIVCGPFRPMRKTAADVIRFGAQIGALTTAIGRAVREARADVLYVNGPRVAPAAVLARTGRPVVFHAHSVVLQNVAAKVAGCALRSPSVSVLASSEFVTRWLQPYVPRDRIRVIYNGVAGFGRTPAPRAAFTRIGVLGRVAPEKGQMTFVRAARIAAERNPTLRFVIGGDAVIAGGEYLEQVRRAAGPEVHFAGWIDDIGAFFEQVDLLAVPSVGFDNSPRVIPESYAAGVPVVAFDGGGLPELIEDGLTGVLVQDRTPEALAKALLDAVQQPDRLNALALRAFECWQQRFRLDRFQSEMCEAIEAVAFGRRITPNTVRASA